MANTFDLTSFPSARDDASEDKWTKYAQALITNGVLSGVANEMQVFADSTGMVVKVKTGRCFVDGVAGDLTTQQSLDIAAADPSNPRIDRVVARLTTTSPATVAIKVITGVAASSPAAPALLDDATHTDIPLATVRVETLAGTIAAGKVTDGRTWVQPGGYSIYNRTEFRGDQSAVLFKSSDGVDQILIGLRSDTAGNAQDLVVNSINGGIRFVLSAGGGELMRLSTSRVLYVNREIRVGDDPINVAYPYVRIGNFGDGGSVYVAADQGLGANVNMVLRSKGTGNIGFQDGLGSGWASIDNTGSFGGATDSALTLQVLATLKRVSVGATDSGGSGYRLLRVTN